MIAFSELRNVADRQPAEIRQIIALEPLAAAIRDVDLTGFKADDQKVVVLFRDELQVVPELVAELDEISTVAQQLASFSPGAVPTVDWSVPRWTRDRERLAPVLGKEAWWPRLVNVYSSFTTIHAEIDTLEPMTSGDAAATVITKVAGIHGSAQSLVTEINAVRDAVAVAVGGQTPLLLTE